MELLLCSHGGDCVWLPHMMFLYGGVLFEQQKICENCLQRTFCFSHYGLNFEKLLHGKLICFVLHKTHVLEF